MENNQLGNDQSKILEMYDIIFCSLPYSNLDQIYSAPAVLKGVAVANNYQAKTIDFGITLLNLCNKDIDLFNRVQTYFISPDNILDPPEKKILDLYYEQIIEFFKSNPTRYIGISVLSIYTHKATFDVVKMLREHNIDAKIVIGGRGIKVPIYSLVSNGIASSKLDKIINYGEMLKKKKLIDHFIIGDGEDAIIEVLEGKSSNSQDHRTDTFKYPLPNYDDYDFSSYLFSSYDKIAFPITGSKGCVRDCDFCDIRFQFGKYRYRTGHDIAKEMLFVAEKYNFRKFQFTDSLVNGGLKPLEEFCNVIADYNLKNPDKRITWTGQYICRPETQMPKYLYKLMSDSGAEGLTIGAESGSNHVLEVMNKKTTVEALYYELEQFRQHNITCVILTVVGHWAETFDDFVEHCRMFVNLLPYARSGTISSITIGTTALLLDETPSMRDIDKLKIHRDDEIGNILWVSELNLSNNLKERLYRRLVISRLVTQLKIPCHGEYELMLQFNALIEQQHKHINEFHEKFYKNFH
jgi:tRNA A37 methylthiotransferase MiaB